MGDAGCHACLQEDFEFRQSLAVFEEAFHVGAGSGATRKHLAQLLNNMSSIKRSLGSVDEADALLARANAMLRPAAAGVAVEPAVAVQCEVATDAAPAVVTAVAVDVPAPAPAVVATPANVDPPSQTPVAPAPVDVSASWPAVDPVLLDETIQNIQVCHSCCVAVRVVIEW